MSNIDTATDNTWLSEDDLEQVRAQLPIVYVEAIPVRVDGLGHVTEIGLLLRQAADGTISRLIVSGRVKYGERVRIKSHEAILDTLDRGKSNRGMRFDEEMVPYCGKDFTVSRLVDRIIHEKTGEMIEMKTPSVILDGVVCRSEVSRCRLFCPRAIPSYWREIWLERTEERPTSD